MKIQHCRGRGFTLIEILVVVAILALLVALVLPNLFRARATAARNICIGNMMQLEAAKQRWAINEGKGSDDVPTFDDIVGPEDYLKEIPICPSSGSYSINTVATSPTCSLGASDGHTLHE